MEYWLPLFFFGAMGLAMLVYVLLDGYDLGVGILLPFATDQEKDIMIASIGPFWDANETWIVLGVGILLIAFPQAHGIVLTSLYLPVTIMLIGLILRGVAFDFRVKAGDDKKSLWNHLFFLGSLTASIAQGWMLGAYITGLQSTLTSHIFSILIAITLPALYVMLGSAWLLMKAEGDLLNKAISWSRKAFLPMGVSLLLVSIATPMVSTGIAEKWFSLSNFILLLPIPLFSAIAYLIMGWFIIMQPEQLKSHYAWLCFSCLVAICTLASIGLGYSIFPEVVIGRLNIWEAAAATESLKVIFVGTAITLPAIILYTIFIYRIFHGKASDLSYGG